MRRLPPAIVAAALFLSACGPLPTESTPHFIQDSSTPTADDLVGGAASGAGG